MSHIITENGSNADFTTGLGSPDTGDAGTIWWQIWVNAFQQLADRSQFLKGFTQTRIRVPLNTNFNNNNRFSVVSPTSACFWQQTDITSFGGLVFSLGNLPTGRKISSIVANILNPNNTTLPVATMPALTLNRYSHSLGAIATIATVSDTTAVVATYKADHALTLSGINHTILDDYEYCVIFSGEAGGNAQTGLEITSLTVTLTY